MGRIAVQRRCHPVLRAVACLLTLAVAGSAAPASAQDVHSDLQTYFASRTQASQALTQFKFVTTGDIHVSQGGSRVLTPAQWQALVANWRDSGYLFGLVVGDLGYGGTQDVIDVANGVSQTPNAPPVFYSMGNHEIDPPAGKRAWIDALYPGAVGAAHWSATVAAPGNSDRAYWSFNIGPYWHFVCLDADISDPSTGADRQDTLGVAQRAWLAGDLAANLDRNVFVFVHEPIDQARYDTPAYTLNDRAGLIELLVNHPKQKFVFSGHLHGYRGITKWKGITSVHVSDTSGATTGGVQVNVVGETVTLNWPGMTAADTVDYDLWPLNQVTVQNGLNVLNVAEDGGEQQQRKLREVQWHHRAGIHPDRDTRISVRQLATGTRERSADHPEVKKGGTALFLPQVGLDRMPLASEELLEAGERRLLRAGFDVRPVQAPSLRRVTARVAAQEHTIYFRAHRVVVTRQIAVQLAEHQNTRAPRAGSASTQS